LGWNNAKIMGIIALTLLENWMNKLLYSTIIPGVTVDFTKKKNGLQHICRFKGVRWSLRNSEYPDLFKVKKAGTQHLTTK
jgi:hypothetical protein